VVFETLTPSCARKAQRKPSRCSPCKAVAARGLAVFVQLDIGVRQTAALASASMR
jgi:hypothetical protein